jgi:hypothetical protein
MVRDLEVRAWCEAEDLRVPALLAHDLDRGWVVLEDFGPDDAEKTLDRTPAEGRQALSRQLLGPLTRLAGFVPTDLPSWNPPLDRDRMRWELAGFELWFVRHYLEQAPSADVGRWLDDLAAQIDEHPRRVCHRDYHLNNLFFLAGGAIGIIDYQDILIGPDTYDAVSLLGERGMSRLLGEQAKLRLQEVWARESDAGPGWRQRWIQVRVQRALKVLGTFSRLVTSGLGPYSSWMQDLAREIGPELTALEAPSELVHLLLDLSRRRRPTAGR